MSFPFTELPLRTLTFCVACSGNRESLCTMLFCLWKSAEILGFFVSTLAYWCVYLCCCWLQTLWTDIYSRSKNWILNFLILFLKFFNITTPVNTHVLLLLYSLESSLLYKICFLVFSKYISYVIFITYTINCGFMVEVPDICSSQRDHWRFLTLNSLSFPIWFDMHQEGCPHFIKHNAFVSHKQFLISKIFTYYSTDPVVSGSV